ncbi:MAG: tagaturonate epimerase family protein [Chloroflexi bacterium]|nr:tagaturonate epimerase family protein [Chloroflexota bacterium]
MNRSDTLKSASLLDELSVLSRAFVYPASPVAQNGDLFFLVRNGQDKQLAVLSRNMPDAVLKGGAAPSTSHDVTYGGQSVHLAFFVLDAATAAAMRKILGWLQPQTLGLRKSAGCGDRLGLATPGHVQAIRACGAMAPIFAQQSIREMARTQRSPQQVVDEAMWGVFQEGWHEGYGADADHLKTTEDIDRCVAAGFTFYTFDPGVHVGHVEGLSFDTLPWDKLETKPSDLLANYASQFDAATVKHAMLKYGRAIAHVTYLYRYLQGAMKGRPFEVEVSVDETEQPTSYAEHFVIAGELRRMGVEWVSLAPRFVGRFEKGVDYIGDLHAFESDCAAHVRVARHWGPYKLSIHSGSDKFSIYPIVSRLAGDMVHLKTAGTSYLEALRTVAYGDPGLFQKVYALAHDRYGEDRASYHVSADPARAPGPKLEGFAEPDRLAAVLDQFDARQMLHVCFGSILAVYGDRIKAVLKQNEEAHYVNLRRHFNRHLESFC